jgi:hypothetical protein
LHGAGIVTVTRIHPGFAALAVVVGLTAALLILQSIERKQVKQISPSTAPKAEEQQTPPPGPLAANRPELTSKLWKQLRAGDDTMVEKITGLLQSVKRIMAEAKLKQ